MPSGNPGQRRKPWSDAESRRQAVQRLKAEHKKMRPEFPEIPSFILCLAWDAGFKRAKSNRQRDWDAGYERAQDIINPRQQG